MKVITIKNFDEQTSDLDSYFRDFLKALLNVKVNYMIFTEEADGAHLKEVERVYAYELYHQIRVIMDSNLNRYESEKVFLHGEPYKTSKILSTLKVNCYPDLVLHKVVTENMCAGQHWICEIKAGQNGSLDDLEKLTNLHESDLGFDHYIFLFVADKFKGLKEKMKRADLSRFYPKIWCVYCAEGKIEYAQLGALYKEIEEKNKNLKC